MSEVTDRALGGAPVLHFQLHIAQVLICRDSKCANVELALSYGEVKFLSGVQDMSCFRRKSLGMAKLISSYEGLVLFPNQTLLLIDWGGW